MPYRKRGKEGKKEKGFSMIEAPPSDIPAKCILVLISAATESERIHNTISGGSSSTAATIDFCYHHTIVKIRTM